MLLWLKGGHPETFSSLKPNTVSPKTDWLNICVGAKGLFLGRSVFISHFFCSIQLNHCSLELSFISTSLFILHLSQKPSFFFFFFAFWSLLKHEQTETANPTFPLSREKFSTGQWVSGTDHEPQRSGLEAAQLYYVLFPISLCSHFLSSLCCHLSNNGMKYPTDAKKKPNLQETFIMI